MLTINALAEPIAEHRPKIHVSTNKATEYATNWAGYSVDGTNITDVKGSWTVPAVTCSKRQYSYSSFWVGIDGDTSPTVEQIGTDSDCGNGRPTYYAWYEFYPAGSVLIPTSAMTIRPGDKISAEVSYDASSTLFTVSITDATTSHFFSTTGQVSTAQRNSAEWIAEAPSNMLGNILSLANFGTVFYGYDYTKLESTNFATANSITGNISSFGSSVNNIIMVTNRGAMKVQPSPLSSAGTSFSAKWYHS